MTAPLSALVTEALGGARVSFGVDEAAIGLDALASSGAAAFGGSAPVRPIGVLLTNDRPTVELFLGALLVGVELVSLPLPARAADPEAYLGFVRDACASMGVEQLVVRDDVAPLLEATGLEVVPHRQLGRAPLAAPGPDGFRLVQFSSGSTSRPKGIRLSDAMLGTNVAAILDAVAPRPGDAAVSWLPLSHDMGLIGMLCSAIVAFGPRWTGGGELALLEPEQFLRSPSAWVECLDRTGATFTAAPDFGYRLAAARRPPRPLDLSKLRCAIVGGEIVRAATLASVVDAFGPHGMPAEALCPAYGMAELGLAAAMTPPEEHWVEQVVDTAALAAGRHEPGRAGSATSTLVGSGVALRGYEVVADGGVDAVGSLRVGAPVIGEDVRTGRSFAGSNGRLDTGDLGFVLPGGEVFVCGRGDDYLVAGGRNLYAPAIEVAVSAVDGVRPGRVTAVGSPDGSWVVAVESDHRAAGPAVDVARLRTAIRRAAASASGAAPDEVLVLARGTLPLTSSGKLQRHEVRRRWLSGTLVAADGPVEAP